MNRVVIMGRLTDHPSYTASASGTDIAKYTLAVDRRVKRGEQAQADFIRCVAFGKSAEFAHNYFFKGMKVLVEGRIQTGQYDNKEGKRIYTTDVIVETQEFCEKKADHLNNQNQQGEWKNVAESDEKMPFH